MKNEHSTDCVPASSLMNLLHLCGRDLLQDVSSSFLSCRTQKSAIQSDAISLLDYICVCTSNILVQWNINIFNLTPCFIRFNFSVSNVFFQSSSVHEVGIYIKISFALNKSGVFGYLPFCICMPYFVLHVSDFGQADGQSGGCYGDKEVFLVFGCLGNFRHVRLKHLILQHLCTHKWLNLFS